jgi:hypothetical protein
VLDGFYQFNFANLFDFWVHLNTKMEAFDSEDFYATMEREALEAMASSAGRVQPEQQKENATNKAVLKPTISLEDQAEADMYEEMVQGP